jgi:uncharacterized protein (DUF4415 family)
MRTGRPQSATPKVHIGFRLSEVVVAAIRATGNGYNARVNEALCAAFVRPRSKPSKAKDRLATG